MQFFLTKSFAFSASHTQGGRVFGHNYLLSVTVESSDETAETTLQSAVETNILPRVHSRDLGESVTQAGLLKGFWQELAPKLPAMKITSLVLERDPRTRTTFLPDKDQ